jgi:hypothetical protein
MQTWLNGARKYANDIVMESMKHDAEYVPKSPHS